MFPILLSAGARNQLELTSSPAQAQVFHLLGFEVLFPYKGSCSLCLESASVFTVNPGHSSISFLMVRIKFEMVSFIHP